MRILLVRHGETDLNAKDLIQGALDIPLNERGKMQAARIAERLKGEKLAAIYSSPLQRARVTAAAIAQRHAYPVRIDEATRERSWGEFDGRHVQLYLDALAMSGLPPHEFRAPGGELIAEVVARVGPFIDSLRREHAGTDVVVTAHLGSIRAACIHALGAPLTAWRSFDQPNAGLTIINFQGAGHGTLEVLGDASHLQGI